jgi:hypothetical protein
MTTVRSAGSPSRKAATRSLCRVAAAKADYQSSRRSAVCLDSRRHLRRRGGSTHKSSELAMVARSQARPLPRCGFRCVTRGGAGFLHKLRLAILPVAGAGGKKCLRASSVIRRLGLLGIMPRGGWTLWPALGGRTIDLQRSPAPARPLATPSDARARRRGHRWPSTSPRRACRALGRHPRMKGT